METITFDEKSQEGLREIKHVMAYGHALHTVVFGSVWLLLLVDGAHGIGKKSWSMPDTEFDSWAAALKAVKPTVRARVYNIASHQANDHYRDLKQKQYWEKVAKEASK